MSRRSRAKDMGITVISELKILYGIDIFEKSIRFKPDKNSEDRGPRIY